MLLLFPTLLIEIWMSPFLRHQHPRHAAPQIPRSHTPMQWSEAWWGRDALLRFF